MSGYTFAKWKDSTGRDIGAQKTGLSAKQLATLCASTPTCTAFTSSGFFKSGVTAPEGWSATLPPPGDAGNCRGLFLSNAYKSE